MFKIDSKAFKGDGYKHWGGLMERFKKKKEE